MRRFLAEQRGKGPQPLGFLLLWLTVGAILLAFVVSEAGTRRGMTVRYVLPFFIVIAAALGIALFLVAKWSRLAAGGLAILVLLFHFSGYPMPWSSQRKYWEELEALDAKLLRFLWRAKGSAGSPATTGSSIP